MIADWESKRIKLGEFLIDNDEGMTILKEIEEDYNTPDEYREKYESLRTKYLERFFSSGEEAKEDQKENVKTDTKNIKDQETDDVSIEDLFEEREGD